MMQSFNEKISFSHKKKVAGFASLENTEIL